MLPRFQSLPRQLEIPRDLALVAERDVVVFGLADRVPERVHSGNALRPDFGFPEVRVHTP